MQDSRNTPDHDDDIDIITPVDFTPPPAAGRRIGLRLRWYHVALMVALLMVAGAAWCSRHVPSSSIQRRPWQV